MTENTHEETIELDFDEWLAGGERKAHFVTLYARADLYADIEELQRQRVVVQEIPEEDRSLSDSADNPNAEIDDKINALWEQLGASKKEFRVSSRTSDEVKEIRSAVEAELKTEADEAAAKARTRAKENAKRLGITAVNDINAMVRTQAAEAFAGVIEPEVTIRVLAESVTTRKGDQWVPVTVGQIRMLQKKLGGSQMDAINQAYSRAAGEAPAVTVPKS
ncbi:hypothetical protein [Arthrobacter sp. D2-10]